MRQSTKSWIVHILLIGFLFSGIFGTAIQADAQERESITANDLWVNGVSNLFKLSENTDPSICGPLLASMNHHAEHPSLPVTSLSEPKWERSKPQPFLLLRNKFLIYPWQRQEYRYRYRGTSEIRTRAFEAAVLDFDGDGKLDGLFRSSSMIRSNYFQNVWYVRSAPDQVVKNEVLEQQTVMDLRKEKITSRNLGIGNISSKSFE